MCKLVSTLLALAFTGLFVGSAGAGVPRVVASILPVHSLVSAVMTGIGAPVLLVPATASPHDYALKPSAARNLQEADLVVWIGPVLEGFLHKPISALGRSKQVVSLMDTEGLSFPDPPRPGDRREEHGHGHDRRSGPRHGDHHKHEHGHGGHEHDRRGDGPVRDPHIWLNPDNAEAMVEAVAVALGARDPKNAAGYAENARVAKARLESLAARLEATLSPVRDVAYVVFHDAYGHFAGRFGLNPVAAVVPVTGRMPGARRIRAVRERIATTGARCVFSEPQFPSRLTHTVIEGTELRAGILDPLGTGLTPGPEAYFALLGNIGESLRECLGR